MQAPSSFKSGEAGREVRYVSPSSFSEQTLNFPGNCYHCKSLPPTLLEWLSSELEPSSTPSLEDSSLCFPRLPFSRGRASRPVYNICHETIATKVWSLEPLLAQPLMDIICKQHPNETTMSLVTDEKRLHTAATDAKTLYAKYLDRYHLISVELQLCGNPAAQGEQPRRGPEDFDDTVCMQFHIRYHGCLI